MLLKTNIIVQFKVMTVLQVTVLLEWDVMLPSSLVWTLQSHVNSISLACKVLDSLSKKVLVASYDHCYNYVV